MRLLGFNFKNEAIWIMIFSLAAPIIGLLIFLIGWFFRVLH
jgi:hypothetical protein